MVDDAPQTPQLGRYQLERRLARGGMGELWLARSHGAAGWEKRVVLKTILPHLSDQPEFVERFLDEAHIATTLSHGNIVPVFELGHDKDTYFIVMEYVDGWDLRTLLRRAATQDEPLPEGIALYIAAEVCRGLDYAHKHADEDGQPRHIVHRDVSPANILLSRDGAVRIVDFGIASARSRLNQTLTGELRGKFGYMSPEQARGEAVDAGSDLFSLGVVLYEMLAGTRPFAGQSDLEVLGRVQRAEHTPLAELRPDLDASTLAVVERALAHDRKDRFGDAAEMQHALLNVLYQETGPVSAGQLAAFCLRFDRPRYSTGDASGKSFDALLRAQLLEADTGDETDTRTPSAQTPSHGSGGGAGVRAVAPAEALVAPPIEEPDPTRTVMVPSRHSRHSRRRRRLLIGIGVVTALILLVSGLAYRLGSRSTASAPVVRIHTEPTDALISFNGVSYGRSTLVARPAVGEWVVRAEKEGFAPAEVEFVYDGRADQELRLTLDALASNEAPGVAAPTLDATPTPDDATVASTANDGDATTEAAPDLANAPGGFAPPQASAVEGASTGTAPAAARTQRVQLRGLPAGASIWVDGVPQGAQTQLRLDAQRPSTVRAEAPGFIAQQRRYDPSGGATSVYFELAPQAQGTLTVRFIGSVLIGELFINGRSHGVNHRAPRTQLQLPVGEYHVEVRNEELDLHHEAQLHVRQGEETVLRVDW